MFILVMLLALCALSVAMSTKEQRAAARAKMKPFSRIAWGVAVVGWLIMLWPWGRP